MNFKLTKTKVIISIIVIVAWYVLIISTRPVCEGCLIDSNTCPDVPYIFTLYVIPSNGCDCDCPSFDTFLNILGDLFLILLPGVLVYLIWSFVQKKK